MNRREKIARALDPESWESYDEKRTPLTMELVHHSLEAAQRVMQLDEEFIRTGDDGLYDLLSKLSGILTRTVDVLRGSPPPLTLWSHHDIPDLAQDYVSRLNVIRRKAEKNESVNSDALLKIINAPLKD